jgi:hypothetical protein
LLQGRGFFIWKISSCEGGDPEKIAATAKAAGLSWVAIKIADGINKSNYDTARALDLIPPVVTALRAAGIQVWGWQYVRGDLPAAEARAVIAPIRCLALDGFIVDAEAEYKLPGRDTSARTYMSAMRSAFPRLPMALCSYRFPSYHREFPWNAFLSSVDLNMPQVYWEQSHDPTAQLTRCVSEFKSQKYVVDVLPIGPTYKVNGWSPTIADLRGFEAAAVNLGLKGTGYFSWDECRRDLPALWAYVASLAQTAPAPQPPAPAPVPMPVPTVREFYVTIGPRWIYKTSQLTGKAIGKVVWGQTIRIVATQGRVGQLESGGWIDIGGGVKPV